jgi:hypothetical protein
MGKGRWASRAWGSKGARAQGRAWRTCGRGRVHSGEIMGGRLGTTDRWGRRDRERAGTREGNGADRPGPWGSERERERERGRAGVGADRRDPPARRRGARARLSGPVWAEICFPFSREFLMPFLFIFSRVFNSNSNQVSNSNQKSNMCNISKNI